MRDISGKHLLMDGFVHDASKLEPAHVMKLFDILVSALGMKYLLRPIAMRVEPNATKVNSDEDDGGWSVMAMITTSHLSIHCWPLRRAFMLDIFSCRDFDATKARILVFEWLGVDKAASHTVDRMGPRIDARENRVPNPPQLHH
jgi:S-adenosylmethionine decarboxylase